MEDYQLILDLVIALGAALAGGAVAQRLGQPVLIGYIIAGIIIGPNTPGWWRITITSRSSLSWVSPS